MSNPGTCLQNGLATGKWQLATGDDNGDDNRRQRRWSWRLTIAVASCHVVKFVVAVLLPLLFMSLPIASCQLPRRSCISTTIITCLKPFARIKCFICNFFLRRRSLRRRRLPQFCSSATLFPWPASVAAGKTVRKSAKKCEKMRKKCRKVARSFAFRRLRLSSPLLDFRGDFRGFPGSPC